MHDVVTDHRYGYKHTQTSFLVMYHRYDNDETAAVTTTRDGITTCTCTRRVLNSTHDEPATHNILIIRTRCGVMSILLFKALDASEGVPPCLGRMVCARPPVYIQRLTVLMLCIFSTREVVPRDDVVTT